VFGLLRGQLPDHRLVSFYLFPERRSEQKWTAGKSEGESDKTITYYLLCLAVAPFVIGNGSVPKTWSIPDILYQEPAARKLA